MKMAGNGDNSLGTISDTGRLASVSEGGVSISFATSTAGTAGGRSLSAHIVWVAVHRDSEQAYRSHYDSVRG